MSSKQKFSKIYKISPDTKSSPGRGGVRGSGGGGVGMGVGARESIPNAIYAVAAKMILHKDGQRCESLSYLTGHGGQTHEPVSVYHTF